MSAIDVEQAYGQALAYITGFADYERGPCHYAPPGLSLARTARLLAGLGDPQQHYTCLLVAGTKGKGSTAAFLERILHLAGWRTGLYTSPHLHTWRERIQVNRQLMSKSEAVAWIERLRPLVEQVRQQADWGSPTYFEISTAIALGYFAAQAVQLAVLEVGLGGRLDATNVVTPAVSILTSIGYDHMAILGSSLDKIAAEKAAIARPAGWVVSAPQSAEAMHVIEATCQAHAARLWLAGEAGVCQVLPNSAGPWPYPAPLAGDALSLRGPFQHVNARVAMASARALQEQGWTISAQAIQDGLRTTRWPARLEVVGQQPWLVLDGAHNVDSARALHQALYAEFSFERLIVVMGFSQGHDVAALAAEMGATADLLIVTRSRHPRSAAPGQLADAIRPHVTGRLEVVEGVAQALARAQAEASARDLICVCGLFVAAEVRQLCGLAPDVD